MKPLRPRIAAALAAAALAAAALPAAGAPCAGFTDVADTDTVCPSVEWLRNRAVTLGCTATLYCPGTPVSRAAMALFMNRLGIALTPQLAFVEGALGAVDPDAGPALCQTAATAAAGYPRQALVSVAFGGQAAGDLAFTLRPVVSTDGGATWQPLGSVAIGESVAAGQWGHAGAAGTVALPAQQGLRFAARVAREGGTADFAQARCQVAVQVLNANGTASPFDGPLAAR